MTLSRIFFVFIGFLFGANLALANDPHISLTVSDGTGLELQSLKAKVVLEGFLAFTELEMVFYNPENRRREGRFQIVLPDEAAISRFAMKIGDFMQEGEVVETQKARRVYEDFLHRRQDPALLETDSGNRFNARIFPIEARSEKLLVLSYSQRLEGSNTEYVLPLKGLPSLQHLSIKVFFDQIAQESQSQKIGNWEGSLVERKIINLEKKDFQPDQDFRLPSIEKHDINLALQGETILAARITPIPKKDDSVAVPSSKKEELVLLIDTSASQAPYLSQTLKTLKTILPSFQDFHKGVHLIGFDQGVKSYGVAKSKEELASHLTQLEQNGSLGASNLEAAFQTLDSLNVEEGRLFLVSDCVPTAGTTDSKELVDVLTSLSWATRVDVLIPSTHRDKRLADQLIQTGLSTGTIIDLNSETSHVIQKLNKKVYSNVPIKIRGADWFWPETIDAIQENESMVVFAQLKKATKPTIQVGSEKIDLAVQEVNSVLLQREWVRGRIEKLLDFEATTSDPDMKAAAHKQILDLSQKERVLSPYTSLLVLETEADYRRYGIMRRGLADILIVGIDGIEAIKRTGIEFPQIARRRMVRPMPSDSATDLEETSAKADSVTSNDAHVADQPLFMTESLESDATAGSSFDGSATASGSVDGELAMSETSANVIDLPVPLSAGNGSVEVGSDLSAESGFVESATGSNSFGGDGNIAQSGTSYSASASDSDISLDSGPIISSPSDDASAPTEGVSATESEIAPPPLPTITIVTTTTSPPTTNPPPKKPQSPYIGEYAKFRELLDQSEIERAGALVLEWRAQNLNDVMALIALGEWYEAKGDLINATRAYGSLIDYFPARADIRRWAAERILSLQSDHFLAVDSLQKALEQRSDHPSGHYLLAIAYWEAGDYKNAILTLDNAKSRSFPRFSASNRILKEALGLMLTWLEKQGKLETLFPDKKFRWTQGENNQLRFVLVWETDANDVDFHIYDRLNNHAYYSRPVLASGGRLYADVTQGYGPENFTVTNPAAFPYKLQAHYYSRGPMGYGMGLLQVMSYSHDGGIRSEFRPFVVMQDKAFVDLGIVKE